MNMHKVISIAVCTLLILMYAYWSFTTERQHPEAKNTKSPMSIGTLPNEESHDYRIGQNARGEFLVQLRIGGRDWNTMGTTYRDLKEAQEHVASMRAYNEDTAARETIVRIVDPIKE